MARKKLKRFADVREMGNVVRLEEAQKMRGLWQEKHFANQGKIVLELACGSGQYTLNLARQCPEKNFIGVDKKGDRIWRGAKKAVAENLTNVAYLNCLIEKLALCFAENEVSEIWITFPDPHEKPAKFKHRLTAEQFLKIYENLFGIHGTLHLKTDHQGFFDFTVALLVKRSGWLLEINKKNIHRESEVLEESLADLMNIHTYYEKKFLAEGRPIHYLRARFEVSEF